MRDFQRSRVVYDGRGARLRREQANQDSRERRAAFEFEQKRPKTVVPTLTSLVEIKKFVQGQPELPIVGVSPDIPIRELGKAVFGAPGGYNRTKNVQVQRNLGPHFDAYARNFLPWTIHVEQAPGGAMRAAFLPEEVWRTYLADTDNMSQHFLDERGAYKRRMLGEKALAEAEMLYINPLHDDTRTLIWHGSVDPAFTPPAVHDVGRPSLINLRGRDGGPVESYTLYARQVEGADLGGFAEV